MSDDVELTGLRATNPMGWLAALGALLAASRHAGAPDDVRLRWTDEVEPAAVLAGAAAGVESLLRAVVSEREALGGTSVLRFEIGEPRTPATDVKFAPDDTRRFLAEAADADDEGRSLALAMALVAEGAYDNSGAAKPTALHFLAGRQQFLVNARELTAGVTQDDIEEAAFGPWHYASKLKSFMWDVTDDRVYALSASNPATDAKRSVAGAELLGLVGLSLLPVSQHGGRLITPLVEGSWKSSTFTWPVWHQPLTATALAVLLQRPPDELASARTAMPRGVNGVYRSAITRSDQGGYGTFKPPRMLWRSGAA